MSSSAFTNLRTGPLLAIWWILRLSKPKKASASTPAPGYLAIKIFIKPVVNAGMKSFIFPHLGDPWRMIFHHVISPPSSFVLKFAHELMMSGNDQSITVLLANSRRHLRCDGLVSVGENVHVHQIVNQLKGLDLDLFGKFTNDDWRFQMDNFVAHSRYHFTETLLQSQTVFVTWFGASSFRRNRQLDAAPH